MSEVWKDVVGFEEYFMVSNTGKVWSKRTNKELKQCKIKSGYMTIATRIGGRSGKVYCLRVHRLVAEAFLPNIDSKPCVNHKNCDRSDNRLVNLEWVTPKENHQHGVEFGFINWDSLRGVSRFSESELREMKYNPNNLSQRSLAKKFGASKSFVFSLQNGSCLKNI